MTRESRKQIRDRRYEIDKELREEKERLLAKYEREVYYPAKQKLYKECEELTGHDFTYSGLSPLNKPIFYCMLCNKTKIGEE